MQVGDLLGMGPVPVRVRSAAHGDPDPDRRVTQTPSDRIRTLLLRADNVLKNQGDDEDRTQRARRALEEAREVAQDPAVEHRVRELIERRLEQLGS